MQLTGPSKTCLKCGHIRLATEPPPDYACPSCGAVYAKLEALQRAQAETAQRDAAETLQFERRLAQGERAERQEAERAAQEQPHYRAAHAVYLLMVLPFAVTQVGAIALAYKMRHASEDSWLNDHFNWQINTFWILTGLTVLAGAALLVGGLSTTVIAVLRSGDAVGVALKSMAGFGIICAIAVVVSLYRIGKGWYRLWLHESP